MRSASARRDGDDDDEKNVLEIIYSVFVEHDAPSTKECFRIHAWRKLSPHLMLYDPIRPGKTDFLIIISLPFN